MNARQHTEAITNSTAELIATFAREHGLENAKITASIADGQAGVTLSISRKGVTHQAIASSPIATPEPTKEAEEPKAPRKKRKTKEPVTLPETLPTH